MLENSENHHFGLSFWLSPNASHFELFPEKPMLPIKSELLLTPTDHSLEDWLPFNYDLRFSFHNRKYQFCRVAWQGSIERLQSGWHVLLLTIFPVAAQTMRNPLLWAEPIIAEQVHFFSSLVMMSNVWLERSCAFSKMEVNFFPFARTSYFCLSFHSLLVS